MRRFIVNWLLSLAICLCALMLILAGMGRSYCWWWQRYALPLVPEFGPDNLAPDFTLRDLDGQPFHLAEEVVKSPVVLEIGSYS